MDSKRKRAIGIDLGTTNSCVAVMEGSEPMVIPNSEGARTTPSIVAFTDGSAAPLVGQIAKRQAITNPENTVSAIKRLMGRKFDDPEVRRHRQGSVYMVEPAKNGDAWVRVRGHDYSPPEISALVLGKMKKTAEDYLGEVVSDAVITVPAYFDDSQRQATKDAGRIAGLNVLRIINEPTAAALAYGGARREKDDERIAVYDLGGGTFDISLLHVQGGVFEVKASNGDGFLGGEDFDQRIVNFLADEFQREHDIDLRKDRMALQRLKEAAERAKHELSAAMETEINLPFIAADASGPKHLLATMTRADLEGLVADLIERTLPPCQTALEDAGWQAGDVDTVILVGGQTRMPLVQEKVSEFFGKSGQRSVNPDEVVAVGAALQAGILTGQAEDMLLLDVTPLSLGVETAGGVFTAIISKNTTIPTRRSQIFSTSVDNQPYVNVHVLQGEREMAADNKSLAHFQLNGIPPAPRGKPRIEVSFEIDSNGIVGVSARDLDTGKEQSVTVRPTSGLSEVQIASIVEEAERNRADDMQKRELAEMRNIAQTLMYSTERAIVEYGAQLPADGVVPVQQALADCREAVGGGDLETCRAAVSKLETLAHKLFEMLQAQSSS